MSAVKIEKENLEAHVELCAERYEALEDKLDAVEEKVGNLEIVIHEIKAMITSMNDSRQKQLIKWGVTIIGSLVILVGWMVVHFMVPYIFTTV
jgi:t-SNARE complex subunit (syntaxin)